MDKSIRVRILDREFGLRVQEETEQATRDIAAYVDSRIRAFKRRHPDQPEFTAAVFTALAIAEDLYSCREQQGGLLEELDGELDLMDSRLAAVLTGGPSTRFSEPADDDGRFVAGIE